MRATVHVTRARRGSGEAVLTYGDTRTAYAVARTKDRGVETVETRVTSGPLYLGDLGAALTELVTGAIARGRGVEHYDLQHSDDGSIVAHTALVAVDTDSTVAA